MKRVGSSPARGIALAVVLWGSGSLSDPVPSRTEDALALVRAQDFTPFFDLAGQRITEFFAASKQERFLEEVFSLNGKWKALTRGKASYERYVKRVFEARVFNADELDRLLQQIQADYAYGIAAADNRLLVSLYEDLSPPHPGLSFEGFRREYGAFTEQLGPHVMRDLGMNLVSIAGSDAAAMLFVSALGSAGILGSSAAAGAAGGPWSFGISLVVGIAAGFAIDAAVGDAFEDAARMEVRRQVNGLRNQVINDVHDALGRALGGYRRLQEQTVRRMYEGDGHDVAHRP